ncbi:hypothetical protein ROS217_11886 [Roseovarius sp. 217]|nr:hypothetical protein ROS217_11886 [Roseovarius sp. 217]
MQKREPSGWLNGTLWPETQETLRPELRAKSEDTLGLMFNFATSIRCDAEMRGAGHAMNTVQEFRNL